MFFGNEGASTAVQSRISGARVGIITPSTVRENNVTHTNLRVRLENPDLKREAELDIQIQLPENAFLTGHWLVIGDSEQSGQITTRNAAIGTYNRNTEQRRDPSLIWYEGRNRLRWRLFPVPAGGSREVRLQISHAGNADLIV